MLNYANLNDVEFENLCKDVMSSRLKTTLRSFATGKDGGIDLVDIISRPQIIVQVKHYVKTNVRGLITELKKEVNKVKKLKPKQYYVCCSKELTPSNVAEIYAIFSGYMESESNILTLIEIEDFLKCNPDILRKHYKLWIASTSILENLYNQNIFIDCEVLLSTIRSEAKYFVQTEAYNQALNSLSKNNVVFLVGDPGVGKTVTSKMLILNYATQNYRIRYATDVTDVASLKRALTEDREVKEVILLDDCLGQAYFDMKQSQGSELVSLIRYINFSKNKLLILNSRVSILQEAYIKVPELVKCLDNKEFKVQVIDISAILDIEKAEILYNHLYFNTNEQEYFDVIKSNKCYWNIIKHKNYNPRIIEFISNPNRYKTISVDEFHNFIFSSLNNPTMVWDDEYEERLQMVDRCLLMVIYSLSNTEVSSHLVKKCFLHRIKDMREIDTTINQFERALKRLAEAFVKIVDNKGEAKLSMINPSVNDYLRYKLEQNEVESKAMQEAAICISQFKRLLPEDEAKDKIADLFYTGDILKLSFETEADRCKYIANYIIYHNIRNPIYTDIIKRYMGGIRSEKLDDFLVNRIVKFLSGDLFNYYKMETFFGELKEISDFLEVFSLKELEDILSVCYPHFEQREGFLEMCEDIIRNAISMHCYDVEAYSFDLDINGILEECSRCVQVGWDEYESIVEKDTAIQMIEKLIENLVVDEISDIAEGFPGDLRGYIGDASCYDIYVNGVDELVEDYLSVDYDEEDRYPVKNGEYTVDIDIMFNR